MQLLHLLLLRLHHPSNVDVATILLQSLLGLPHEIAEVGDEVRDGVDAGEMRMVSLDAATAKERVRPAIAGETNECLWETVVFAELVCHCEIGNHIITTD